MTLTVTRLSDRPRECKVRITLSEDITLDMEEPGVHQAEHMLGEVSVQTIGGSVLAGGGRWWWVSPGVGGDVSVEQDSPEHVSS